MNVHWRKSTSKSEIKVPSGQIGSAWEWYHWISLKKDINRYMFLIFNFDLEYLRRVQSSEPLHTKMHLIILLLVGIMGCMATNPDLFRRKMWESQQLFLGLQLVSKIFEENQQSPIQTKIEQQFGGFFQQIKVWQPLERKDSKQTVIPTSRTLDSFLYEAAQNFELFSNIQDQNLKNQNHIVIPL